MPAPRRSPVRIRPGPARGASRPTSRPRRDPAAPGHRPDQGGGPLGRGQGAERGQVAGRRVGGVHLRHGQPGHDLGGGRGGDPGRRVRAVHRRGGADGRQLGAEQRGDAGRGHAVGHGQHLAQHAGQLVGHLGGGPRTGAAGSGCGGPAQQPVEGLLLGQQRHRGRVGQAVRERALVPAELEAQHGQRPADGVEVGGRTRPVVGDLRAPGSRPCRRSALSSSSTRRTPPMSMSLSCSSRLDHVVGLEVAVDQAAAVQVAERGEHLDGVGQGRAAGGPTGAPARSPARMSLSDLPPTYSITM